MNEREPMMFPRGDKQSRRAWSARHPIRTSATSALIACVLLVVWHALIAGTFAGAWITVPIWAIVWFVGMYILIKRFP